MLSTSHQMQKPTPTWTIVQFSTDNTVEAVPPSWIEQYKCYWPPFKYEQIITAIRKNVKRNTCWPRYDIIPFWNSTYDDYNTARLKTKKTECTFDLNSEIEGSTKRKRKINHLHLDETGDDNHYNSPSTVQKQIYWSVYLYILVYVYNICMDIFLWHIIISKKRLLVLKKELLKLKEKIYKKIIQKWWIKYWIQPWS